MKHNTKEYYKFREGLGMFVEKDDRLQQCWDAAYEVGYKNAAEKIFDIVKSYKLKHSEYIHDDVLCEIKAMFREKLEVRE